LYILFVGALVIAVPLSFFSSPTAPLTEALGQVFPNSGWIIGIIHLAILSAILGTIHSIIWGSSNLFMSLMKKLESPISKRLVSSRALNIQTSVLLIGIASFASFSTIRNLDLFFDFTAIFLVAAYVSAMITLLTMKKEWKSGQNIKTLLGIGTALLIMTFALQDVVKQFSTQPVQEVQAQQETEQ